MDSERSQVSKRIRLQIVILALGASLVPTAVVTAQNSATNPPPAKMRDQRVELAMKIRQPWTLAAVGDLIEMQPFSKNNDPAIQAMVHLLRGADMTVANMESMIVDFDNYTGPAGPNLATKEVADDMAAMGIRMVTKANNHTFDGGEQGMWENFHQLERVGIIHVGAGRSMAEARSPRYCQTPKGLVGLIGIYTDGGARPVPGGTYNVTQEQLAQLRAMRDSIVARRLEVENPIEVPPPDEEGMTSVWNATFKVGHTGSGNPGPAEAGRGGGRGGEARQAVNSSLRLTQYNGVTADQMTQLRAMPGAVAQGDTVSVFGQNFRVTPKPGEYTYDINAEDERDILRNIKTGKQCSDFLVATIHWHQNRYAFQHYSFDHYPAEFEIKLAHEAIDMGADTFVGHGIHTIKGVEIYKGKPIFYGVSNYVFQSQIMPMFALEPGPPVESGRGGADAQQRSRIVGLGEENELRWAWLQQPDNLEALLTTSHFENGALTEVRIYPVDIGLTPRPGSQLGIPRKPTPEIAQKILEHVVKYSKPFGTKIVIENGVGIIRIPPNAQTASH